jgi:hypothetical protein
MLSVFCIYVASFIVIDTSDIKVLLLQMFDESISILLLMKHARYLNSYASVTNTVKL